MQNATASQLCDMYLRAHQHKPLRPKKVMHQSSTAYGREGQLTYREILDARIRRDIYHSVEKVTEGMTDTEQYAYLGRMLEVFPMYVGFYRGILKKNLHPEKNKRQQGHKRPA